MGSNTFDSRPLHFILALVTANYSLFIAAGCLKGEGNSSWWGALKEAAISFTCWSKVEILPNLDGIISGVLIKLVGGVANVALDVYQPCLNHIIFFIRKNMKSFPHMVPIDDVVECMVRPKDKLLQ